MALSFSDFLISSGIEYFAALPLRRAKLIRPDKLERTGITEEGSALIMLLPYLVRGEKRNISAYAVPRDYHAFFSALAKELIPLLEAEFPGRRFIGTADNSPLDEVHAAHTAGLGFFGDNGLFMCEKYGSYIFIGEILSDMPAENFALPERTARDSCARCGACRAACPTGAIDGKSSCLSALTQKKGELSVEERDTIIKYGSAWGCDICQDVCPHNKNAAETPIEFFRTDRTPTLTREILRGMSDEEFAARAYSWRGRPTIMRNLEILEEAGK